MPGERYGAGCMITVKIEATNDHQCLVVVVRAGSIEQAVRYAEERYAECDVRVVFPLDPDNFFARDANAGAVLVASDGAANG
jgi:DNA primase